MTIDPSLTVRELALRSPGAIDVFEAWRIDYCCSGGKSLREACKRMALPVDVVVRSIEEAEERADQRVDLRDWRTESLSCLIRYVVDKHHVLARAEMERLEGLLSIVCSVYGITHRELIEIRRLFRKLKRDLLPHMLKEEQMVFPYLLEIEDAEKAGRIVAPPSFVTVNNSVRIMMMEHEGAAEILSAIRDLTRNFQAPSDTSPDFLTLWQGLAQFEIDLHRHIHLENNVLFLRAVELEARCLNRL